MANHAHNSIKNRKTRDRALALLLAGVLLLATPVAGLSAFDARIAGLPVTLLYIFAVWGGLILGALALARSLSRLEQDERAPAKSLDDARPKDSETAARSARAR